MCLQEKIGKEKKKLESEIEAREHRHKAIEEFRGKSERDLKQNCGINEIKLPVGSQGYTVRKGVY